MDAHVKELLQQMHETEKGGIQIYRTALSCVVNDDLKKEWTEYLEQTQRHERVMSNLLEKLGVPPEETPGRKVVRHIGESLVTAMKMAKSAGEPEAAEIVATECVVFAETKDHMNWHLLNEVAAEAKGEEKKALTAACEEVEDEEDEHIYHSKGWCRELWMNALGLDAVLPPPEEQKQVKTAIGAARAEQARDEMK
jgi:rubrerythrin